MYIYNIIGENMDPTGKKTKGDRGVVEYADIDYIDKYR
jgi:hypothetical protein